uniref:Uncharacterized protein n=1 Tax=Manihot esculenta TaxID=3983 RepID=A0A2C9UHR8_MANES
MKHYQHCSCWSERETTQGQHCHLFQCIIKVEQHHLHGPPSVVDIISMESGTNLIFFLFFFFKCPINYYLRKQF